jgi:hypothetical protein
MSKRTCSVVLCCVVLATPAPTGGQATSRGSALESRARIPQFDTPAAFVRLQVASDSLSRQSSQSGLSRIKWYWRVLAVSVLLLALIAANWK